MTRPLSHARARARSRIAVRRIEREGAGMLLLALALAVGLALDRAGERRVTWTSTPGTLWIRVGETDPWQLAPPEGKAKLPCSFSGSFETRIAESPWIATRDFAVRLRPGSQVGISREQVACVRGSIDVSSRELRRLALPANAGVFQGAITVAVEPAPSTEVQVLVTSGFFASGGRTFGSGSAVRFGHDGHSHGIPWPRGGSPMLEDSSAPIELGPNGRQAEHASSLTELASEAARECEADFQALLELARGGWWPGRHLVLAFLIEVGSPEVGGAAIGLLTLGESILLHDQLRAMLDVTSETVSKRALRALARLGDLDIVPLLESGCARDDSDSIALVSRYFHRLLVGVTGLPATAHTLLVRSVTSSAEIVDEERLESHVAREPAWHALVVGLRTGNVPAEADLRLLATRGATGWRACVLALAEFQGGNPARLEAWSAADPEAILDVVLALELKVDRAWLESITMNPELGGGVRLKALDCLSRTSLDAGSRVALALRDAHPLGLRALAALLLASQGADAFLRKLLSELLSSPSHPGASALLECWAERGLVASYLERVLDLPYIDATPFLLGIAELESIVAREETSKFDIESDRRLKRILRRSGARALEVEAALADALSSDSPLLLDEALTLLPAWASHRLLDLLIEALANAGEGELPLCIRALERLLGRRVAAEESLVLGPRRAALDLAQSVRAWWRPPGWDLLSNR